MKSLYLIARNRKVIFFLFLFIITFLNKATSQPGSLDTTFGKKGKTVAGISNLYFAIGNSLAIQSDGKIIISGYTNNGSGFWPSNFGMARILTNGNADSSFGTNGIVTTDFDGLDDQSMSVGIDKNGRILLAGHAFTHTDGTLFALCRYKLNGQLDSSFGNNGKLMTGGFSSYGYSIIIQPDNKILLAGDQIDSMTIVRYLENGQLDSSFGVSGMASVYYGHATDIALQEDGNIVLAGYSRNITDFGYDFTLLRVRPNGKIDSSFGINGAITTSFGYNDFCYSVAIQSDGKIIAGGYNLTSGFYTNFVMVRYQQNGLPDSSFGINGKVSTDFSADYTQSNSIKIQVDGKILIAGNDNSGNTYSDFALARYNANGFLDSSFGTNGKVITDFAKNADFGHAVDVQADGKIIVAGTAYDGLIQGFAAARYNVEGTLAIHLLSFDVINTGKNILLNWQTATESDNAYFSVERSNDGINFLEIGKINSYGNSNQVYHYTFTDVQPLFGANYYRLKQVDKNGQVIYSKIKQTNFEVSASPRLFPNPARDLLILTGLNSNSIISLYGFDGRLVDKKVITGNTYNWNISDLPSGNYYLNIQSNNKITTLKFIKQ